ncbi:E3 ubiquitin-protein ligase upl4 [Salvia divinorum]|uniref:E3 ubiquitin-protein ligase upl4 n=1 Tax=Salvia divinorum TaxID=28513 RepID=A0ABD1I9M5_SALDI
MATARFDMEKFTGKNDFGLWRIKMRAILIQQGLADAIKTDAELKNREAGDERSIAKRQEIMEKAHSAIILSLGDRVLREVSKETSAASIWAKLEGIYMTKSLANRLYMKQKVYSYKFVEGRGVVEQLEEFNKSLDDLENIDVQIEDEDKAIMLLNALPKSYEHLKDAMLFGRENTISFDEVQSALKAKEFQRSNCKFTDASAESLSLSADDKAPSKKKGSKKPKWQKGKKDDPRETRSCHWCKKPGHLKKDCYAFKRKQAEENKAQDTADLTEHIVEAEILNVTENQTLNSWIMDSGCSFHMTSNKGWLMNLEKSEGSVLLGNDHICHVEAVGSVRLRMHDGSMKILSDVRYIPDIKRNLISLGLLERKGVHLCFC